MTIQTILLMSLGFLAASLASTAIHEIGHAVAGHFAGYTILTCGIGVGRPLVARRLFGVCFYLTTGSKTGLTLAVHTRLHVPDAKRALFLAGGVAANLVTALLAGALWYAGVKVAFVGMLGAVSAAMAIGNLIPFEIGRRGAVVMSDGRQLLRLWRGDHDDPRTHAARIKTVRLLRDLCRSLGVERGVVIFTQGLWLAQLDAHDLEAAEETRNDPCLAAPSLGGLESRVQPLATAVHLVATNAPNAGEQIERALADDPDDPLACALLELLRAGHTLDRGEPAGELASRAISAARRAGREDLEVVAEVLRFEAEPPPDLAARCADLRARLRRSSTGRHLEPRFLSVATLALAKAGDHEGARLLFEETLTSAQAVAAERLSPAARDRFLKPIAARLAEAAACADAPLPLFVPGSRRPSSTVAVEPTPSRGLHPSIPILGLVMTLSIIGMALWVAPSTPSRSSAPPWPAHGFEDQRDRSYARELNRDVKALAALAEGSVGEATETIEDRLDHLVVTAALGDVTGRSRQLSRAIERVRDHREKHPRHTDDEARDREVREALARSLRRGSPPREESDR